MYIYIYIYTYMYTILPFMDGSGSRGIYISEASVLRVKRLPEVALDGQGVV